MKPAWILTAALALPPLAAWAAPDEKSAEEEKRALELQKQRAEQMKAVMERAQATAQEEMRRAQSQMRQMQILIQPWANPLEVDKEFDKVRVLFDMAQAQHEIVMILIEDGKYDEATQETSKIMRLGFPERYDLFLLNEIDEVVGELERRSQDDMAIKVLETGKGCLRHPEAKAGLLMEVARLHKKHNRKDLAIKTYREAVSLQQQVLAQKIAAQEKK
ncbi:MAG: hypothetical protein HYX75_23060 [Acidobacteria bacterium]|nr:hypothetical protein [Acidobacteriota bacterium]